MRLQRLNPGQVVLNATQQLSKGVHDGKNLILNSLTGHTITLPPAVGSGCTFRIYETVAPTSGSTIIKVAPGSDVMIGAANISVSAGTDTAFPTAPTSDTITLNRGTTGGALMANMLNWWIFAAGMWSVSLR
jgi:predicted amino acid racemase